MSRSLRYGRQSLAIPGPSVVPDRVLSAMHRPMPNIYDGELIDTSLSVLSDLPAIARTDGHAFVAISNGHGGWEMALTNTLSRGDKVLIVDTGVFGRAWANMARKLGLDVAWVGTREGQPVDATDVEAALRADTTQQIRALLLVHVDTATSVRHDVESVRAAMDAAGHSALLMVDCIASLCCDRYEMDAWGVDVTIGGSQKGLMVPPGLGVVWANEKALDCHAQADLRSPYWDWQPRLQEGPHYVKYCGTPPIQHVFAMREALDMLAEEGLENVWWRHQVLADSVRSAVDGWSTPDGLRLAVVDPEARSNAVTTIVTGSVDSDRLRALAEDGAGLVLGIDLGDGPATSFRIGHMGHLNPAMLLGTLGTIESVLVHMGAPMGSSGVAAAAATVARHLG